MFLSQVFIDNQFKVFVIEILAILLVFSSWTDNIPTITKDNEQEILTVCEKNYFLSAPCDLMIISSYAELCSLPVSG